MFDDTCHPSIDAWVRVATATAGIREVAVATATEESLVSLTTAVAARLTAEPDAATDVLMARKLPTTIRSPRPIIIPSN